MLKILCTLALLAVVLLSLWPVIQAVRPKTLTEALIVLGVTAVTIGAMGCTYTPLTPSQQEARRQEWLRNSVEYCEVRGGQRSCTRISRDQLDRILRGAL